MKSVLLYIGISLSCLIGFLQDIDSLSVLKQTDWRTLRWFDQDTVILLANPKITSIPDSIKTRLKLRKHQQNLYGERINFDSETVNYSYYMSCPVGESNRNVISFKLIKNAVIVEFETKKWPYKDHKWTRKKRYFNIIEWSKNRIVLK